MAVNLPPSRTEPTDLAKRSRLPRYDNSSRLRLPDGASTLAQRTGYVCSIQVCSNASVLRPFTSHRVNSSSGLSSTLCRSLEMRAASALAIGLLAPFGSAWPLSFSGILKKRAASFTPLRFTSDGTFQISVFNDLHYGEGEQEARLSPVADLFPKDSC